MMKFDEFKEKVAREMKQRLGEGEIILQNIMKNNDTRLTGLSIISPNTNLSPTIYLEKYYQDLQSKTFAQVVDEIWKVYKDNRPTQDVNVALFKRWDLAKARIVMKLVNYEYNRELLKTVPYDRFLDLAVIYYYILDISEKGAATILIHNSHLDMWGVNKAELKKMAYINYRKFYEVVIKRIEDVVLELIGATGAELGIESDELQSSIYIVTNQMKLNGATSMLFPEKLQEISEQLGSDLYILPSSIHEILVCPKLGNDIEELKEMVNEVNTTCVDKTERLSDSIYCYSRKSGRVDIAVE